MVEELVLELLPEEEDDAVVEDTILVGSLIMNGGLVPPSYTLALNPDNGARDR
jgi:hypothetical protein